MSNPEPTRNHDAASFVVPSPSFVAVRYFKVRPTGAHLISRAGKRQSVEKDPTPKSRCKDFHYALDNGIFCQPTAASDSAEGELCERSTAQETADRGSRCDVCVRKGYSALAGTKRRTSELFYLPLCGIEWPADKRFDDAFCNA